MSHDFDYEAHERLRERVANEADSVLWTFKAYYEGADWYSKWDRRLDWLVFGISALLTIALIWSQVPQIVLISLAILSSAIVGYRRMADPGDKAENFYRAANAYQRLFDDFRDYIQLELADETNDIDELQSRYRELASQRRNLNEDMPDVRSRWYERLDDSIYEEISTTDEAKQELTGKARIEPQKNYHDLSKEEIKDRGSCITQRNTLTTKQSISA